MLLYQILAIVLVLGLLMATLSLLRRRGFAHIPVKLTGSLTGGGGLLRSARRTRQMELLERIGLSPQHSLHLVHVRNDVFLIGVSPAGCSRIATFRPEAQNCQLEETEG